MPKTANTSRWKNLGDLMLHKKELLKAWKKCDYSTDSQMWRDIASSFWATKCQIREVLRNAENDVAKDMLIDDIRMSSDPLRAKFVPADPNKRRIHELSDKNRVKTCCLEEAVEAIAELIEENRQLKEQLSHLPQPSPDVAVLGTPHRSGAK